MQTRGGKALRVTDQQLVTCLGDGNKHKDGLVLYTRGQTGPGATRLREGWPCSWVCAKATGQADLGPCLVAFLHELGPKEGWNWAEFVGKLDLGQACKNGLKLGLN